jgi:hypothetical protein
MLDEYVNIFPKLQNVNAIKHIVFLMLELPGFGVITPYICQHKSLWNGQYISHQIT